MGLVAVLVAVAGAATFQLPDVCLCNPSSSSPVLNSCLFRYTMEVSFAPCPSNVTAQLVTNEGKSLQCVCATKLPPCQSLSCFVTFSVSSALYAVLSDSVKSGAKVDVYSELEYLYGENAELLVQYRARNGLFGTTLRRHGSGDASGQVFWYGLSPIAEVLMQ